MTYGGFSILHGAMRYGSAAAGAGMRVVVARDGGFLAVNVADKDGKPVPQASVYAMPKEEMTTWALSAALVSGRTDQSGRFLSNTLAPGKYYVLATEAEVFPTPECLENLWRARTRAKEVEVPPRATAQTTMAPMAIN
jgi:protocatechuate 3,4-dioxygenase beta subunit